MVENIIVRPINCLMKRLSENEKLNKIFNDINLELLNEYNLFETITIQIEELNESEQILLKEVLRRNGWKASFSVRNGSEYIKITEI